MRKVLYKRFLELEEACDFILQTDRGIKMFMGDELQLELNVDEHGWEINDKSIIFWHKEN